MSFTTESRILTLEGAQGIAEAALEAAAAQAVVVTIAIVDAGGHPVMLCRMDGVHAATVDVATAKARSAALFKRPTSSFVEGAAANPALPALPHVVAFPGGQPLRAGGSLVGAIGVSGAAPNVDDAIALAGAAILERHPEA